MSHTGTTTKGLCAHPGWNMPVQRDSEMPKVCESENTKSRLSPVKNSRQNLKFPGKSVLFYAEALTAYC